jgi:formamidopyrimidine-DNA glycosylase
MSGQLLLRDEDSADDRHVRVRLWLEHPTLGILRLDFADQRIFGSLAIDRLVETPDAQPGGYGSASQLIPSQASHISRDALDPHVDDTALIARFASKSSEIKRVLLDQQVLSGIGNIYADEALWAARIHPRMPANALTPNQGVTLLREIRGVLEKALAEGGTSFDAQYVNVNGQAGYFAHSLNAYGRTGKQCPRCGTALVRESFMNRSSHFCPDCQALSTQG